MSSNPTTYTDGGVTYTLETVPALLGTQQNLVITYADGSPSQTISNVSVLTGQTSFTLSTLLSIFNFNNYFIPPGTTTNLVLGASFFSNPTFYVGGNVSLSSGVSVAAGTNFVVTGPNASLQAGSGIVNALSGMNVTLEHGGSFEVGWGLVTLLSSTSINFDSNGTGGTFIFNGGNDLINFGGQNAFINLSGATLNNFDASTGDRIEFKNVKGTISSYQITDNTDGWGNVTSQVITLYDGSTAVCGITVNGNEFATGTHAFGQSGPLALQTQADGSNTDVFIDPTGGVLSHLNQTIVSSQSVTGIGQATPGDTISLAQDITLTVGNAAGNEAVNNNSHDVMNIGAGATLNDQGGLDNSSWGAIGVGAAGTISVGSTDTLNAINNSTHGTIVVASNGQITDAGGLNNSTYGTIGLGGSGSLSVNSTDGFNAINNSTFGTITAGQGEQITDAGGLNNSTRGVVSLAGNGTLSVASTDPLHAIDNSTFGTITAGQGEQITDAGGLNNSTNGTISLAGGGTLSVGGRDPLNAINNSTFGTITAGQGEQIIDSGGLNNSAHGVFSLSGATASITGQIDNDANAVINIDNGSTLTVGSLFGGNGTIAFGGTGNTLSIGSTTLDVGNLGTISGFTTGDAINLAGTDYQDGADSLSTTGPGLLYGDEGVYDNGTLVAQFATVSGETFSLSEAANGDIEISDGPVSLSHANQTLTSSQVVAGIQQGVSGQTISLAPGVALGVGNAGGVESVDNSGGDVINLGAGATLNDQGGLDNSNSGTVSLASNGTLSAGSTDAINAINNSSHGTIVAGNAGQISDAGGLNNSDFGTISLVGNGTLSVNSTDNLNAINNSSGGTITAGSGEKIADAGGLNNSTAGVVNLNGATASVAGEVDNDAGGTINIDNGSTLAAGTLYGGTGTIAFGGTGNTLSVGSVPDLSNLGTISGFNAGDEINLTGTQYNSGDSIVSNGSIVSIVNNNGTTIASFTTIAGEDFGITAGANGNIEIDNQEIVHSDQTISQSQTVGLINDGSMNNASIALGNGVQLDVTSASAGAITNTDGRSIDVGSNGDLGTQGGVDDYNHGTINVAANGGLTAGDGINNSDYGTIAFAKAGALLMTGLLNNSDDGFIDLANGSKGLVSGTIDNENNGTIDLSGGSTLTANGLEGTGGTISFQGTGDQLNIAGDQNLGTLVGLGASDEINLTGTKYAAGDSVVSNGSVVSIMDNGKTIASFATVAGETIDIAGSPTGQLEIICFLAGTHIATPKGEVEVQSLKAGDMVLTANGAAKPVRWLGQSTVSTRFADPLRSSPIRITAGALGENLPVRDLLVSPAHAMFVNGVLVEAGAMVNGTTIRRETMSEETFVYYHVELEAHDLIVAEGAACESFIDNVDRMNFDNWSEHDAAALSMPMVEMSYPRAKSARQVPQMVRQQLGERAAMLSTMVSAA